MAEYFARADAAFDEIELLAIEGRLTVHDIGRRLGWDIFNCNTLGYGTNLFLFTNEGMSLFECMGLDEDEAQRLVKRLQNDEVEPEEHARLQALLEAVLIPDFPEYSADPSVFSTRANWHERLRTEGRAIVTATNPPGACAFVLDQAMAHVIRKRSPIRRIGAVPPKMPGYMNIDFLTVTTRTVTEAWFPLKGTAS